ncbi:radical SAM protein [Tepidicaulis marinus]|uniref:Dual-specificity RNA methyltransferase RlmN n=1 Tax=Tepidicaulis marinus TaxID=1333998 RepID=A0A081B847_9HYPH|nr:23S rRNA (adenine(2503)-C(2))-methyltransferase RlmN [Tepidicaulis marinus]GAK44215.1 radical SAM protein [Tepidicaulis marinus]
MSVTLDISHEVQGAGESPPADQAARANLIGLPRPKLQEALEAAGIPANQTKMRAGQLWTALYHQGLTDFAGITTLSKALREELASRFTLKRPEIVTEQISSDGTRKWLIRLASSDPRAPAPEVEAVYIPEPDRGTLCISSQVGCTLNCTFCHTGTQKLVRNLTAEEIVAQILIARDALGEWPTPKEGRKITNIVLMGMGEPLYNFDNVKDAIDILSDGEGLSISKRRITLSTSGVVPMIEKVGSEIGCMLAISLHAVNDPTRDMLVPLNKKYPIAELLDACRNFPGLSNARRITFEYVMLKGVNDSKEDAKELVRLLKGIPAKINLIPFNAWPGAPYECSDWEAIETFADIVNRAGYASPIRTPRGRDIMAACGQLKSESERLKASLRAAQ